MSVAFSIQTPAHAHGAVGIVQLSASSPAEMDTALWRLGLGIVETGRLVVRDLLGVDRGVVARWSLDSAHLMPHGGPAVVRALTERLARAGLASTRPPPRHLYPEARTDLEAHMLDALARAASPLAIEVLLAQPSRWEGGIASLAPEKSRCLRRLLDPPVVVILGPPNVGKSTLTNTLAGRTVSIVSDEPGTTRDHVGVLVNLGGLVVRLVDAPGWRSPPADPLEAQALEVVRSLLPHADLVILAGDILNSPPSAASMGVPTDTPTLTLATRIDLGEPGWSHDLSVSAAAPHGVAALVRSIRDRLVPPEVLADPAPWAFWDNGAARF